MERQGVEPGNINWRFSDFRERRYCSYSSLDSVEQRHTDGGASVESSEGHVVVSTYRLHTEVPLRVVRLRFHHMSSVNRDRSQIRSRSPLNSLQNSIRNRVWPHIQTYC
jgi:hypothetical protein